MRALVRRSARMDDRFVLAVVSDLFFIVKIGDAAKRLGLKAVFVSDLALALEKAKDSPAMVLVDLNNERAEPVELVKQLKSAEQTKNIPLVGYLSHVQLELKRKAEEAGCDRVLARSTVSEKLGDIFSGVLSP